MVAILIGLVIGVLWALAKEVNARTKALNLETARLQQETHELQKHMILDQEAYIQELLAVIAQSKTA